MLIDGRWQMAVSIGAHKRMESKIILIYNIYIIYKYIILLYNFLPSPIPASLKTAICHLYHFRRNQGEFKRSLNPYKTSLCYAPHAL